MNVCLYGPTSRWTMTERGEAGLSRTPSTLAIGPSRLEYEGDSVVATLDERATPLPRPVRGRIRVIPEAINPETFTLGASGRHAWRPVAPAARVEVTLDAPALSWSGHGYLDMNVGAEPLEAGFRAWDWSRCRMGAESVTFYEGDCADGDPFALALRFAADGTPSPVEPPPIHRLRRTNWLLPRTTRADGAGTARTVRMLEDTPFYTRSVVKADLFGSPATSVHESVDLRRFSAGWVQHLLPYRMPRRPR